MHVVHTESCSNGSDTMGMGCQLSCLFHSMAVPRGSNMLASVVCSDISARGDAVACACSRCEETDSFRVRERESARATHLRSVKGTHKVAIATLQPATNIVEFSFAALEFKNDFLLQNSLKYIQIVY